MSITLPPVTAGPILLNDSPVNEMFLSESDSEFFCAKVNKENKIMNITLNGIVKLFMMMTRN
jgi:hypothetical protein